MLCLIACLAYLCFDFDPAFWRTVRAARSWAYPAGQASRVLGLLAVVGWLCVRRNVKVLVAILLTVVLSMALASALVVSVKGLVQRPRPHEVNKAEREHNVDFFGSWSFPSGDATLAFAGAAALAYFLTVPWRIGLYALAALVAANRVLVSRHYLSDAAAGAAAGILCALAALAVHGLWARRSSPDAASGAS